MAAGTYSNGSSSSASFAGGAVTAAITEIDGTAGAPSYAFTNSTSTGMYSPAANQVALAQNGVQALLVSGTQAVTFPGSITVSGQGSLGTFTFTGTNNTDFYGIAVGNDTSQSRIVRLGSKLIGVVDNASSPNAFLIGSQYTVSKAADYIILARDSGTLYHNTAAVTFTLPASALGLRYRFVNRGTATQLSIKGNGAEVIALDGGTSTATTGAITSVRANSYVELTVLVVGTWHQTSNTKATTDFTVT